MGVGRDMQKWADVSCRECRFGEHDACDALEMPFCECRREGHPEEDPWKGKTRGEAR